MMTLKVDQCAASGLRVRLSVDLRTSATRFGVALAVVLAVATTAPCSATWAQPATVPLHVLSRYARLHCPDHHVDDWKAADFAQAEDDFSKSLAKSDQDRLDHVIPRDHWGAPKVCQRYNGLVCPANAELNALAKADLVKTFARWVCRQAQY